MPGSSYCAATLNEVTLIWVPAHYGILGNEMADRLARQASAMPLFGPEPALGIPKCLAREAIKSWTTYQHSSTWKIMPGCRHGKLFIGRPCKKRADDLLNRQASTKNGSCNPHWTCSCERTSANFGPV
jgi:hypothetical protein